MNNPKYRFSDFVRIPDAEARHALRERLKVRIEAAQPKKPATCECSIVASALDDPAIESGTLLCFWQNTPNGQRSLTVVKP